MQAVEGVIRAIVDARVEGRGARRDWKSVGLGDCKGMEV